MGGSLLAAEAPTRLQAVRGPRSPSHGPGTRNPSTKTSVARAAAAAHPNACLPFRWAELGQVADDPPVIEVMVDPASELIGQAFDGQRPRVAFADAAVGMAPGVELLGDDPDGACQSRADIATGRVQQNLL